MMIKTILTPLDGSPLAEQALRPAASLAHDTGASLVLLRAHVSEKEREHTQQYLQSIQHRLEGEGLAVRTVVLPDRAATAILSGAQEQHADLICMTSHGTTGLRHVVLGSVTEAVVRQARTPVQVVRVSHDSPPALTPLRKLLVPLDGSHFAEAALTFLALAPFGPRVEILLLRVVEATFAATPAIMSKHRIDKLVVSDDKATEPERAEAAAYLNRLGHQYLGPYTWRAQVAHGVLADEIISITRGEHAGAILMTTHGRHGADLLIHGSVAFTILNQTEVPLILLPEGLSTERTT
jgi:nucleotide-binding universal stress UspA family protein